MPPTNLQQTLKSRLHNATAVVLLGVGSELRGDDAAGLLVAEQLSSLKLPNLQVLIGGTAPENLTGEIKRLKPSHLLIVDAADLKEVPGTIKLLAPDEIGGFSFSTHALPLKVMIDFILADHQCEVIIIAIQPKDVNFGAPVAPAVQKAIGELSDALRSLFI
ncbi:MAG TPA: hydrogenase maturation peptidase HycI [Candidatus Sulfotelmatobacter sp.]|nr:hydrogenase maturation peptidase HycI [Candidatus Sulfotelmatobacter sp.]